MIEPVTLLTFFKGLFKIKTGVKATAFLIWMVVIIVTGYTFWRAYFKKQPNTTTQNAESIINRNYFLQPRAFGCARLIVQPDKK